MSHATVIANAVVSICRTDTSSHSYRREPRALTCKGVHIVDSTDSGMQDLLVTPTPIPNLQQTADLLAPQELHYLW